MEIPSSSPCYTPLNDKRFIKLSPSALLQCDLFPESDATVDIAQDDIDCGVDSLDYEMNWPITLHYGGDDRQEIVELIPDKRNSDNIHAQSTQASPVRTSSRASVDETQPEAQLGHTQLSSLNFSASDQSQHENLSKSRHSPLRTKYTAQKSLAQNQEQEQSEESSSSSDGEETIYSDDEDANPNLSSMQEDDITLLTQEIDPQKSTQNYLEELITESLLESLPLPPAKRAKLVTNMGIVAPRPEG